MWAGADLTWHLPIMVGTKVKTDAYLKDLIEHQTRFAGRAIQQIYHVDLSSSDGELLCSGESWCFRTERDAARKLGTKYDAARARPAVRYSGDEIQRIWHLYEGEIVRGAVPRHFEDVALGDELPPIAGKVTGKGYDADGRAFVEVEQAAHNQHGDLSAVGTGTIWLPTRP